jgi:predicted Zn-dependent peptidase
VTAIIHSHTYDNGLTLVAEPMSSLESAAFTFLVPSGSSHDPKDRAGLSNFTQEMMLRGCGPRDARQFVEDLDNLGVERGESVSAVHASAGGATLADNLYPALAIFADFLRRPHLPSGKLEAARQVVMQDVLAVEDDPSHKLMEELRRQYFPSPFGWPSHGDIEGLEAATLDDVAGFFERVYRPDEAILGVAGRIDWLELRDEVGELLGDWKRKSVPPIAAGPSGLRRIHIEHDSQQTQIGIAFPTARYCDPDYFEAFAGIWVLGGSGCSARFFHEVREKRGLCYSVSASTYNITREHAGVLCYAGTTAKRAQETLDVMLAELRRLPQGISDEELSYLKARVKSALIMQQESSASRSGSIARDWYHLGRVRTLEEVGAIIDGLTRERINRYLAEQPPLDLTIATLGPKPLVVSGEW